MNENPPDPRLPVIVGVGQHNQRVDRGEPPLEPTELLAVAMRRAATDTGASVPGAVLAGADSVRVVSILSWRYRDPGALVAGLVGAEPRHTAYTNPGGNSPQMVVNRTAVDISEGRADLVLIGGAEAWRTRIGAKQAGGRPEWTTQDEGVEPTEVLGADDSMSHPAEVSKGLFLPIQIYPLFENALRAAQGHSWEAHLHRLGDLWSRFSAVAAGNPEAWIQRRYSSEEVRTPGPDNRMIGFPYPKLMNSNNSVEQSAALIMCSVERATELGVPRERWVFPLSGTGGGDSPFVSHRGDLYTSPAIRIAGGTALDLAGTFIDDVAHVDLYSCFPSAVQVAADELGLGLDRDLTVTGGLSFAGGPWNNYVTHAIAAMVQRLRDDPGAVGLCTANGGFLTKHSFGTYRTEPPAGGRYAFAGCQAEIDATSARREVAEDWEGPVTVESATVMHDRDGEPETGFVAALVADGRRAWGTTAEADALKAITTDDVVGRPGHLADDGAFELT